MGSTMSTSNNWVYGWFNSHSQVHLYNIQGGSSSFWTSVGYSGSTPWKALLDRDGNIRKNGSGSPSDTLLRELLGLN